MSKTHLNVHLPLVEKDGMSLAILVGEPELEIGQVISLKEVPTMDFHYDMYVRGFYQGPLKDIDQSMLGMLGYDKFSDLRLALVNTLRVGLPADVGITVIMMADPEVDFDLEGPAEEPEAVLVEDSLAAGDDVLEVVEDTEEDDWFSDEEEILDILDDED